MSYSINSNWYEITSFEDLQTLMDKYLSGDIENTPWHLAPLMPETSEILSELKALNAAGLVPYNSQPGLVYNILKNGRQRAYIDMLVKPEKARKLVEHFSQLTQYRIFSKANIDVFPVRPYTYPVTQDSFGRNFTHGPSNGVVNALEGIDEDEYSTAAQYVLNSLVTVNITDTRWGTNDLWSEILKAIR